MTTSYCCECDTTTNPCPTHPTAHRYLDSITYEPVTLRGKHVGWKVPDHERHRWDNPPKLHNPKKPAAEARDINHLLAQVGELTVVDQDLEHRIRQAHTTDPAKTTRIIDKLTTDTEAGKVSNPGGMLTHRLKHAGT